MATFFIHIDTFSENTILGKRLQEMMLDSFQHMTIDEIDLPQLENMHDEILSLYIRDGGKGRSEFNLGINDDDEKGYSINKGIRITCTRIRGSFE